MPRKKKTKAEKSASKPKQADDELQVIEDVDGDVEDIALTEKKVSSPTSGMAHGELKELIEKNIKWSQVIYNQNKKIKRRLTMMVIGSYIRLALILTPIILGIIFLPPLVDQYMSQFGNILGGGTTSLYDIGSLLQNANLDSSQVQELINQVR